MLSSTKLISLKIFIQWDKLDFVFVASAQIPQELIVCNAEDTLFAKASSNLRFFANVYCSSLYRLAVRSRSILAKCARGIINHLLDGPLCVSSKVRVTQFGIN